MIKKIVSMVIIMGMILCLAGCGGNSVSGYYESLDDGKHAYNFIKYEKNSGVFEEYKDGEIINKEENIRITDKWKLVDDVLILNDDDNYYKVYDDCLIYISEVDEEPSQYGYIAPKGKRFNYTIGAIKFFDDGTFYLTVQHSLHGEYYVENNIIYMKWIDVPKENAPYYSSEYEPGFYLYDDDHIIDAGRVWIKKLKATERPKGYFS